MKGQISRQSHAPRNGYSGVFHIQGGMITDADLNEGARIARDRVEALGNDAVRDGVPAAGGVVRNLNADDPKKPFEPYLHPGIVYADGLRGEVRAEGASEDFQKAPLELLLRQEDLREAFKEEFGGEFVVYADLWHRSVAPIEDARLLEVALHGAETSLREKTMAQLKVAPLEYLKTIEARTGLFATTGTGTLAIAALSDSETGNDCDPCAREIPLEDRVPNALFRIEVIAVERKGDAVESVTLAWSSENATEIALGADAPEHFTDDVFAYEHTSRRIEEMKGVILEPGVQELPTFHSRVQTLGARPLVRRWDGAAKVTLATPRTVETRCPDNAPVSVTAGGRIDINAGGFQARLQLGGREVIAGDYWLVELRTNARQAGPVDARFHVVSAAALGIGHHYCPLFRLTDGKPEPLTDAEERRLSFPALSDLPARHVGFDNTCETLYGDAENVQEALDNLCGLDAGQIALSHDCDMLYGDATTVEEALDNLCGYDFGKHADRTWMRYICDWGVICGLKVKRLETDVLHITDGAWLDWLGAFEQVNWEELGFEGGKVPIGRIRLDPGGLPSSGEAAIGIELVDGKPGLVVAAPSKFTLPADQTMEERQASCEKTGKFGQGFDFVLEGLAADERKLVGHAIGTTVSGTWKAGALALDDAEYKSTRGFVSKMTDAHSDADKAVIETGLAAVEESYPTAGLRGDALKVQRGRQIGGMIGVIIGQSEEAIRACKCYALWPDCIDRTKKPPLTPIGKVTIAHDSGKITRLTHVCMLSHRRQAMTPRAVAYYLREVVEQIMVNSMIGHKPVTTGLAALSEICCPEPKTDGPGRFDFEKRPGWFDDLVLANPDRFQPDRFTLGVDGLTKDQALGKLADAGVLVDQALDFSDAEAREKIAGIIDGGALDERIALKEAVGPGDRVLLLTNDDMAEGYLVISRGQGRSPFTPLAGTGTGTGKVGGGGTLPDRGMIEEDLKDLEGRYATLEAQIDALDADGGTLRRLEEGRRGIAEADETLGDLEKRQAALVEGLQAKFDELLDAGMDAHEAEMTALLEGLAERFGALETSRAELAKALEAATASHDALAPRVGALTDALGRVEAADLDGLQATMEGLKKEANETQAVADDLKGMLDGLGDTAAALAADQERFDALAKGLPELREDLTALAEARKAADAAHEAALARQQEASAKLLSDVEAGVAAADAEIGRLEDRHTGLAAQRKGNEDWLGQLEKDREAKVAETARVTKDLTEEIAAKRGELAEIEQALGQTQGAFDALQKEAGALTEALRRERPVAAIPGVAEGKWTERLHRQGIFSVGEVLSLNRAEMERISAADKDLAQALGDWMTERAGAFVKG